MLLRGEHTPSLIEEPLAGEGEFGAAAGAVEEPESGLVLEGLDLAREV